MENGLRGRILDMLERSDATLRTQEIAHELNLTSPVVRPVLRELERAGKIRSRKRTSGRSYYAVKDEGTRRLEIRQALAACALWFRDRGEDWIADLLEEHYEKLKGT